jgi:bifunctional non-homologous end joining protein LigD
LGWTARYGPIPATLASLPVETAYLDGEIVVLDSNGVSSFATLHESLKRTRRDDLTYQVFDILHLDDQRLTSTGDRLPRQ